MKLSIIIPVYNTESYLKRCLDSIFNQDLLPSDYEVIVINDGSTDNSLEILKEFEKKHENLLLLTQENKGEAATRNKAIEISRGNYIAFVDSDDALYENTLQSIISYLLKHDLDILYLSISEFNENFELIKLMPAIGSQNVINCGTEHARRPLPATIYRASLAKKVEFPSDVLIGPDSIFNFKVQYFSKKVSYWEIPTYKYTIRMGSLSKQGKTEKAYRGFLNGLSEIYAFEELVNPKTEREIKYFENFYHIFITRILEHNILPIYSKEKYNTLVSTVKKYQKKYLLRLQDEKYPYFSSNFNLFKLHQKILKCKSKIYRLLFK